MFFLLYTFLINPKSHNKTLSSAQVDKLLLPNLIFIVHIQYISHAGYTQWNFDTDLKKLEK